VRIAIIVPGGVDRSGEYRVIPVLLALIGRLSTQDDVHVIALGQERWPDEWPLAGAQIHNIGADQTVLRAVRTLRALHRGLPFDIVHAIWSGWSGLVAATATQFLGIPSVVHVAGGELACIPDIAYGGCLRWRGRLREALTLRSACAVTAASDPTIATLRKFGVRAQRVPLGVDLRAWPPRPPVRRGDERPARLIHVASLNPVKDQSMLLRALAALRGRNVQFEMDIVGEDTLQGAIQAMVARAGLSASVRFRGFLPQRLLRPLVESADLMIVSSRHETGPVAMLEAAVAGVPTVGTAVGHLAEWAPDAALSVPVGDSERLAAAIAHLYDNEERRLDLALAAQRRAMLEDADHTAARFRAIYRSLVPISTGKELGSRLP
jgi:glycosyltransferase involved in cell wall biosynthesis